MTRDYIVSNHLTKEIRSFTVYDDVDYDITHFEKKFPGISLTLKHTQKDEFSDWNRSQLKLYFEKVASNAKAILEIGVCRNDGKSSTWVFLSNKKIDTFFFGVDIEDKSFLNDESKNVFTLRTSSSNIEEIMSFVKSKGVEKFDFIFIDGWHSINQVLDDWKFVEFLAPDGIVGFHDTNIHPGPLLFVDNLDPKQFDVEKKCTTYMVDFGISFVSKK